MFGSKQKMKIPFDDPFTSQWSEIISELESKSLYTFDLRNICSIFPLSLNQIFTNIYLVKMQLHELDHHEIISPHCAFLQPIDPYV